MGLVFLPGLIIAFFKLMNGSNSLDLKTNSLPFIIENNYWAYDNTLSSAASVRLACNPEIIAIPAALNYWVLFMLPTYLETIILKAYKFRGY